MERLRDTWARFICWFWGHKRRNKLYCIVCQRCRRVIGD